MRGLKFRGRPPINFADSVKDVVNLDNPYAKAIMDRSTPIDGEFIDAIAGQSVFSWEGRKPQPALDEDGNFQGTDLDLLSFLAPLAERGAVIEFPKYESLRASTLRSNERRISTESRFGGIICLQSNKDFFSFSLKMVDNSVIVRDPSTGKEKPGAFRNFMVVAPSGEWHKGWQQIVFNPTAAENAFLTERGLWTDNTVYFKNAIHPNRWQSVFGAPYLLLKMLMARLTDERTYYGQVIKELQQAGFTLPEKDSDIVSEPSGVVQEKVTVKGLEAELDLPELVGKFPEVPRSNEGLLAARERANALSFTLKPRAQVIARADELAYFMYGKGRIPAWMGSRTFEDFKVPGGRLVWRHMKLSNEVGLRYRLRDKTDTIATRFAA